MAYNIGFLGRKNLPFHTLEILELNGKACVDVAHHILDDEYHDSIVVGHECTQAQTQDITDLWNELPFCEQSRCHMPAYAIRIWYQGNVDFVASICWQCDNVYIAGSARLHSSIEFQGDCLQAQALLTMCKNIFD